MGVKLSIETIDFIKGLSDLDILKMADRYEIDATTGTQKVTFSFSHDGQQHKQVFASFRARMAPMGFGAFMADKISCFRFRLSQMVESGEWLS